MNKARSIRSLYYITHINNIQSILKNGILPHRIVDELGLPFTPIYDTQIVSNRRTRETPQGKSLWNYANLYFQPRNPMLYRVINEKGKDSIVILGIAPQVLDDPDALISVGNAASPMSTILPVAEGLKAIDEIGKIINSDWWKEEDGSKRKIMAELLIPAIIPPNLIHSIYVANRDVANKLSTSVPPTVAVVPEPQRFFQPARRIALTETLSLIEGDMFFSQMQTLTISVNTVGVMGKGLASRAKYQFPDVYVFYQDLCRQNVLKMGLPYVYKRESPLDELFADDVPSLQNPNSNKWFLLFPTKRHWRDQSDLKGIEEGLMWVSNNYALQGITSLAMPALGCGLGQLKWADVGPLMCAHLAKLNIQVSIYLPQEQKLSPDLLSKEYLLFKNS